MWNQPNLFNNRIHPSEFAVNCVNFDKNVGNCKEMLSLLSTSCIYLGGSHFDPVERRLLKLNLQYQNVCTKHIILLFLLRSGDVHPNPGPRLVSHGNSSTANRTPKCPCLICAKGVTSRSKAVKCDQCEAWAHVKCTGNISESNYTELLSKSPFNFLCQACILQQLPFYSDALHDVNNCPTSDKFTSSTSDSKPLFEYFKQKGLHFIHINARSLLPKITELKYITANTKAAILSVTETWLDDSVSDAEIQILGYILRRDRARHGGGVCVYIRSDIAFNERLDLQNEIIETLWIDLLLPKTKPILIGTCYRPPNQNSIFSVLKIF